MSILIRVKLYSNPVSQSVHRLAGEAGAEAEVLVALVGAGGLNYSTCSGERAPDDWTGLTDWAD